MSALFGASEAFLIFVTLYEKAKQKSSRGGVKFLAFSTLCVFINFVLIKKKKSVD